MLGFFALAARRYLGMVFSFDIWLWIEGVVYQGRGEESYVWIYRLCIISVEEAECEIIYVYQ